MKNFSIFLILSLILSLQIVNAQDIPGSEDHPIITRYPGSQIAGYQVEKYFEYDLATGPVTGYRYISERDTIAGKVTRITYYINKPKDQVSIGEVYQDNLQALEKAGLTILAKGFSPQPKSQGEVGMGGWIGTALKPNRFSGGAAANVLFAGTSTAGGTFAIVGELKKPNTHIYIAEYGERHSKDLLMYHIDIIEEKVAETGKVMVNAEFIQREIENTGSVSIYGINFDTDSAEIKAESMDDIAEIANYLTSNPQISMYVVGHTDMQGSLEYNMKLSKERAKAIVEVLVNDKGIDKNRLIDGGVGFLAPKSTNATEEGRALNRRTELVKKNDR